MEYIIDLGSFSVEADNEEQARKKAREMIKNGWVEIDQIIENK
jgi:hypothetical protein